MSLVFVDGVVDAAVTSGTAGVTTQDFTVSEITRTAKAARIIVTSAIADDTLADHYRYSDGMTDGTTQYCVATVAEDALGTSDDRRYVADDAVIALFETDAASIIAEASFDSFIAGGIRLTWEVIPDAAYRIHVELWFGEDLEVDMGKSTPPVAGDPAADVVCGFQPKHIITLMAGTTDTTETITTHLDYQIGHHVSATGNPGTLTSKVLQRQAYGTLGTSNCTLRLDDVHTLFRGGFDPADILTAETDLVETYDDGGGAAGFTIQSTGPSGTGPQIMWMALNYGDLDVDIAAEDTPTSTGSVAYEPGFPVQAVFGIFTLADGAWPTFHNIKAQSASYGNSLISLHGGTFTSCMSVRERDASSTTETDSFSSTEFGWVSSNDGATAPLYVPETTIDASNGIDINWTTIDSFGRKFLLVQLERAIFTGSGTANLPLATATGTGTLLTTTTGTGAGVLPLPEATGTGTLLTTTTGTGAGVLPLPEATGTGTLLTTTTGTGAGVLPLPEATGTGTLVFTGTGAGVLPLPEATGTGTLLTTTTGTGAGVLPLPEATGTGTLLTTTTGTGAGVLPLPEATGTGTLVFTGTGAGVLPLPEATGTGTLVFTGTGAGVLPLPEATGTGTLLTTTTGTGAGVLPLPEATGTGTLVFTGTGAGVLPLPEATGTGTLLTTTTGTGAGVLPLPEATGTGTLLTTTTGTGAGVLPLPEATGTGTLVFTGTGAGILPLLVGTGVGNNGAMLGCTVQILGSYSPTSAVTGSHISSSALLGSFDEETSVSGSFALSSSLLGRYNLTTDLDGEIC